jgi:hypothetical protein
MPSKDNALVLFRSIGDIAASLEAARKGFAAQSENPPF